MIMFIMLDFDGEFYITDSFSNPSSDQSTINNAFTGTAARKHMFERHSVVVAGFNDHVKVLAYCARPLTIEHRESYHQTKIAFLDADLNTGLQGICIGILPPKA